METIKSMRAWKRIAVLFAICLGLPAMAQAAEMTVGQAVYHDTSPALRDLVSQVAAPGGENKVIPIGEPTDYGRFPDLAEPDGGLQKQVTPGGRLAPTPAVSISAPGLSEADNRATVGFSVVPPDVNGDIGLDDAGNRIYIQYINSIWGVFNVTGALIAGPFAGNTFWTGFGGPCETNNDGDPVVLYDDQAGRWVLSQFSIGEGIQCMAVSTTSDPLGTYNRYAFTVTPGGNNDYPKLGVWDDGTSGSTGQSAYTFTLRDFGGAGGSFSVSAGVMERDAMLVGAPADFVKFSNPCNAADCIEGQLPPHLAGPTPPAGTCPTFWTAVDAAYNDSPFANDGYRNHTLCVNWANPALSTYSEGPLVVAGSNFDRFLGNGFSDCIGPVNGGEVLDCLAAFTMYRAQYRWFGDNARVVFNTTVDAGGDRAGIRWAETRSADGDSGWTLRQDGTYAPADGLERWMGSIAQDQDGNIALGYSVTGSNLFPSVRYTTRTAGDAAGTMPGGEVSCHEGTGAQVGSSNRWGDYSSMSVDPSDDCTFWYTQEYYQTTSSFNFNTRICSFRFADCGTPPPGCTTDADCDNGSFCDGAETCNVGSGICEAGTPPVCDDGAFCNGVETCSEGVDTHVCGPGTPPACDDGLYCNGTESCNEGTDSCDAGTPPVCDDGAFCNGTETCSEGVGGHVCDPGTTPCPDLCDETNDVCIGCGDGTCDPSEDCNSCPQDCISGDLPGATCGNGLCEVGNGENGVNCSTDCRSKLSGKPQDRFSCGNNDGYLPDDCGDPRCTSSGFSCTTVPTPDGSYCCGDATCEGAEDSSNCALDCGAAPYCGDGFVDFPEVCDLTNLDGQDCESLGFASGVLSCSDNCTFDTSLCVPYACGTSGSSCTGNSDCCSNKCNGKPGSKTCN